MNDTSHTKNRPENVPVEAVENNQNEWELGQKNEQGQYIGIWKWWKAPLGYLICETTFDNHGKMLNFTRYHPNGEVARRGTYHEGVVVEDEYFRLTETTPERFAFGTGEPTGTWSAKLQIGVIPVAFDYYDRDGNLLNPSIQKSHLPFLEFSDEKKQHIRDQLFQSGKSLKKGDFGENPQETIEILLGLSDESDDARDMISYALNTSSDDADILVIDGDVHLEFLPFLDEIGLVGLFIRGNLLVDGTIRLGDDPENFLIVTGNVVTENLITAGMLLVSGDVMARSCIIGDYNHGSAIIFGAMKARFFYPEEYYFGVFGDIEFDYAFGNSYRLSQNNHPEKLNFNTETLEKMLQFLHPNILDNIDKNTAYYKTLCQDDHFWDYIDRYQLFRYLESGYPFFGDRK